MKRTAKGTELPMLNLRGKDYLEVKYRIVWFREEHPDWSIATKIISVTTNSCLTRAVIRDPSRRVVATAHKFETKEGFADFIEKSETGSIGRALAWCGYGTVNAGDELDEGERIVDAPVERPNGERKHIGGTPFKSSPKISGDPGDYVIRFGKYTTKRISDLDIFELNDYVSFLTKDKSKPLNGPAAEFVLNAEAFLGSRDTSNKGPIAVDDGGPPMFMDEPWPPFNQGAPMLENHAPKAKR